LHQILVRKWPLRILVEPTLVGVSRRGVEIEVVLFDVLAVIPFGVGEAEEPLLQDWVDSVPQRQRQTQVSLVVAEAREAVLAPAVGTRASLVVTEVAPSVAVVAVVLAHRTPLSLAQIRTPLAPGNMTLAALCQALR